jgi:hypothetical protein
VRGTLGQATGATKWASIPACSGLGQGSEVHVTVHYLLRRKAEPDITGEMDSQAKKKICFMPRSGNKLVDSPSRRPLRLGAEGS